MHLDIRMVVIGLRWRRTSHKPIGIDAMNDLDVMSAGRQLIGYLAHEDSIPAEVVGRIERRDHAEAKILIHDASAKE
jgi:hypothetical protein